MGSLRRSLAVGLSLLLQLVTHSNGFVVNVQDSPATLAAEESRTNDGLVARTSAPPRPEDLILDEITISDKNSGSVRSGSIPANDKILTLIVNKAELEKQLNHSAGDQDPAASESIFLNLPEFGDVEDLEDVLAVAGYEPQKIDSKSKRKVTRASNDYPGHAQAKTIPPLLLVNNERVDRRAQYAVAPPSFQNVGQYPSNTEYPNPILAAATLYPVQPAASEKLFITPPSTFYPLTTGSQNLKMAQTTFAANPTEGTKFNDGRLKENPEPTASDYVGLAERAVNPRKPAQLTPASSSTHYVEPTKRRKVKARGRLQIEGSLDGEKVHALSPAFSAVRETTDSRGRENDFVLTSKYNVVPRPFSLPPAAGASYQPLSTMIDLLTTSQPIPMKAERGNNPVNYSGRSALYDTAPKKPSRYADAVPNPESKEISAQAAVKSYGSLRRSPAKNAPVEKKRRFDNTDEESVKSVEILRETEKERPQRANSRGREIGRNEQGSYAAQSQPIEYKINETPDESHGHGHRRDHEYDNAHGRYSSYDGESAEASGSGKYSGNYESGQARDEGVENDGHYVEDQGHFVDHGDYRGTGEDYENYHGDRAGDGGHDESGASGSHEGHTANLQDGQDGGYDRSNYQQVDHGSPGGFGYEHIEQLRQKYEGLGQDHGDYRRHDQGHEEAVEDHADQKDAASGDGGKGEGGHGGGDQKFEMGGGGKKEEAHHASHGQEGDKGYKSWHESDKAKKGHHDKERHSKQYDEENGAKKDHEDEGGYHEEHHEGQEGEKGAKFNEKGEHNKGHSTKGEHFVHKKDEYEKKTEFFDEFHEGGDSEKDGEYHHEHEEKKGDHKKVGHYEKKDHDEKHGKESKYAKGGHHHDGKGHKVSEGHEHHYDNNSKHGKKGDEHDGKKWMYKKGGGDKGH